MEIQKELPKEKPKPIFRDLTAEDPEPEATEIESLCLNCGKNGITRLLLTKIPHYKDVVVMSFDCEHCGHQNNEIQNSGKIAEKGVRIILQVKTSRDLNRQVVKSDYTSVKIPSLDFEIPSRSQKGEVTTIEGIIERTITGLEQDQPDRRKKHPDAAAQIDKFVEKLRELKSLKESFIMTFEDISGECYVENPKAPLRDEECTTMRFKRTAEQDHMLGIYSENTDDTLLKPIKEGEYTLEEIEGEVLSFRTNCPECNCPCETNMKMTNIPHFKEVVIMATVCESCGHRTNEVKSGGGIEPLGVKIEVTVAGREDFNRDLLKSETCHMQVPELELEIGPATLGGRFTTVEGILVAIKEQLSTSTAFTGDSSNPETKERMETFISQLSEVLEGKRDVTLVLDDPTGNSYVQSLADEGLDSGLKITKYERSFDQNEELGLNDMKVEDY
ncbi:zinc finger protein ZPR1-like [Ceratina calcarata]|uniref:Zinc finger protein ZPR1 n=1 Tax=Ceratina calcarata TaxID=156304 RepID=A0AAJ7NAY9_9HYME|nr:zinc finger protein ZPR1-like [Ceratina calcarata]XP_017885591.1 zinc finger protein ZPR1-like [Ceratina calcarata]XP_017885592.1 zinc finger protein ZPR1-like [Ceratina calcarata]XP_017885593.1 zinc finger protein ZPR1-like [Ceratina calcarata]